MPLRFSSPPRRRLEHGSEVHGHGRLIARSGARANTVPSSCVTPMHATSGDGPNTSSATFFFASLVIYLHPTYAAMSRAYLTD